MVVGQGAREFCRFVEKVGNLIIFDWGFCVGSDLGEDL